MWSDLLNAFGGGVAVDTSSDGTRVELNAGPSWRTVALFLLALLVFNALVD